MRDPDDLEEFESWRDEEPPPRPCPECGDDDRHMPDCSRNYKRAVRADKQADAQHALDETYWLGYRHGQRIAQYAAHLVDHSPAMREELKLTGTTNRVHRAFALGELRGYRQATNEPYAVVSEGHQVLR